MDSDAGSNKISNLGSKILMLSIYAIIIILIPIFLDYLFRLTVRRKRKLNIMYMASKKAKETTKPLLIFNSPTEGFIKEIDKNGIVVLKEPFKGNIVEILSALKDNSFVIVVSETLEHIHDVEKTVVLLKNVSGGDMYIICTEKNSPRTMIDYKIINIFDKPFYLPSDTELKWSDPNDFQKRIQSFYKVIFRILPYNFFMNDPIEK